MTNLYTITTEDDDIVNTAEAISDTHEVSYEVMKMALSSYVTDAVDALMQNLRDRVENDEDFEQYVTNAMREWKRANPYGDQE